MKPIYSPRLVATVGMLLMYQFVFLFLAYGLFFFLFRRLEVENTELMQQLLTSVLAFIMLIGWISRKYRLQWPDFLPANTWRKRLLLPIVMMVIGADLLISEISNRILYYLPNVEPASGMAGLHQAEGGWLMPVILAVLMAPVLEEIVFRGLLFRGFLINYSPGKTILFTSLLFGLFHMNLPQFVGGFCWGLIASWLLIRTGSLLYPIIGHAVMNGFGLIAMYLAKDQGVLLPGFSTDPGTVLFQPLWLNLTGVVLFILGALTLRKLFQREGVE